MMGSLGSWAIPRERGPQCTAKRGCAPPHELGRSSEIAVVTMVVVGWQPAQYTSTEGLPPPGGPSGHSPGTAPRGLEYQSRPRADSVVVVGTRERARRAGQAPTSSCGGQPTHLAGRRCPGRRRRTVVAATDPGHLGQEPHDGWQAPTCQSLSCPPSGKCTGISWSALPAGCLRHCSHMANAPPPPSGPCATYRGRRRDATTYSVRESLGYDVPTRVRLSHRLLSAPLSS